MTYDNAVKVPAPKFKDATMIQLTPTQLAEVIAGEYPATPEQVEAAKVIVKADYAMEPIDQWVLKMLGGKQKEVSHV